jgi:hypothetical protein
MRVYRKSRWFLAFRIFCVVACALNLVVAYVQKRHGEWITSGWIGLCASVVFPVLIDQVSVEIQQDHFTVRFWWGRQIYFFTDVTGITPDEIVTTRFGDKTRTVKVDRSNGKSLQLMFPSVRDALYKDLFASWHAATDTEAIAES